MEIEHIEVGHYEIPLPAVLTNSKHGEMRNFALVTALIRCKNGEEGLGYTYTVRETGGHAVRSLIERDLAPILLGEDTRRTEYLWEKMWWYLHWVGRGGAASFAIAAVDIALWDLKARTADEPLWRFLGGHSNKVEVYAGGIDLRLPIEKLLDQTQQNLDKGFRAIKMKVGRERLSEDVQRVAAMREFLGPNVPLMVDANMCWSVDQAVRAARSLAEYDVYWLEEPVIPDDIEGHVRIMKEGGLPIAAGENLHKMIAQGAVSFPEPDITNMGGITVWMKIAHLAEAFNLPVKTHGVHDLHVHLLAAVPNSSYLEAHGFGLESFIQNPLEIRDGLALAPNRPGHGVEFDWNSLEIHSAS
jgi:L-alanine-DL-glutamate epimerase-like enolase superfamily enzyme